MYIYIYIYMYIYMVGRVDAMPSRINLEKGYQGS